MRVHLKGNRYKTKGIHFSAAESIAEYIKAAGIESGPLFRPRVSRHGDALAPRRMAQRSMYRVLMSYLERLPGAMQEKELADGQKVQKCIYFAALTAGDAGDAAARRRCAHRVRPGSPRPQANHHNADLLQAAPLRPPQGADLTGYAAGIANQRSWWRIASESCLHTSVSPS